jgi:peptidoglycan hydrolase-like amidase
MIKKRIFLYIALLLLMHVQLMAQPSARVAGNTQLNFIVKDQVTGFAVPDATIQIKSPDGRTSALRTAANGRLQLPASNGKYSFVITASGYQPLETFFGLGADSAIEANINLDPISSLAPPETVQPLLGNPSQVVLSGFIRDADANSPLAGVTVSAGNQTAVTDSKGFFAIKLAAPAKALNPGSVPDKIAVRAVKAGYVPYTIQNLYAIPDSYSFKLALTATGSARWNARTKQPAEETEVHTHGLFDRTEADEQQRYSMPAASPNARTEDAAAALAVAVPSSIRVGTSCSCTSCSVVQVMSLEAYTQSGLNDEWIASWGAASLQAGAVAYRTYGAWYVLHPVASGYDIAATTCNQVWDADVNTSAKNAAIATAGTVLIKNNALFRSEYSAENNNSGCGNGFSGTGTSNGWPCISDARCAGRAKNGHGRGMCQWGSSFWASDKTFMWILNHYYNPGNVFVQSPTPPPPPPVTTMIFSVKDQGTGTAIGTTSVAVTAPNGTTSTKTTDAGGKLIFKADSGAYTFAFSKSGYATLRTSFTGGPNDSITADINLDPASAARAITDAGGVATSNQMTVNGYVHDASLNSVLAGAQVQIGSYTTTTDHKGYFSITVPAAALAAGKTPSIVSIRSAKAGYSAHTIQNFYVLPDTYTVQIGLLPKGAQSRAAGLAQPDETTESYAHGLFNRIESDEHTNSNARVNEADAVAAAAVPTSIRVVTSCACSTCPTLQVQVMSLEAYVQSGLDDEWLSSWNAASLQAGAVAYRSRGAWYVQHPVATNYDLSSAACHQTWQNDRAASAKNAAIATKGIVLVKNGAIVKADYCAESNNAGCGNGFSGTGTTWPCIADSRCAGRATNGHGRGMCQWGSSFWGTDQTYTWILNHYYNPDSTSIQLAGGAITGTEPDAINNKATALRLSPNPVTGSQVKLAYTVSEAQNATITLMDNFGRAVRSQQVTLQAGYNNLDLYTGKLKAGIYTVQIRFAANGKTESSKLVVAK